MSGNPFQTNSQEECEKIIAEIKIKLIGKSYFEISEILSAVQYELMNETIYQSPV